MRAIIFLLMGTLLCSLNLSAQTTINSYARVTAISGNTLSLSNVNETFDTYENGERVLIIQVQDDVIGNNTASTANFGNVASIQSTGLYEFATILSHTEVSGIPNNITLSAPLLNVYHTGANSRVQIVSFPRLGNPNYTTSSDIIGLPWDGNRGGVVAFEVAGVLNINHNIHADAIGFRGGSRSVNFSGPTNCTGANAFISGSNEFGSKGEGIYANTNNNFAYARSKMLNGGGGGGHHNSGGAGGGNYTTGGNGGPGYNGTTTGCSASSAAGIGGTSLASYISVQRVFMGGGGGGGQQNNSVGSDGGNGGGFVYVKAHELRSNGNCSNRRISANGANAANAGNDGAGGGGAAGTVILHITTFNLQRSCPLLVTANGGNGGNSTDGVVHAAGGGGAQGAILYAGVQPGNYITNNTLNGLGGCNNRTCTSSAQNASGMNNSGVLDYEILAVALSSFDALLLNDSRAISVEWVSASEHENEYFILERSQDGINFEEIYTVEGAGTSDEQHHYNFVDYTAPSGVNYYRLKQHDFSEKITYSELAAVELPSLSDNVVVYPNPARDFIQIQSNEQAALSYTLLSANGQVVKTGNSDNAQTTEIQTATLPRGVYVLQIKMTNEVKTMKVVLH